MSLETAAMKILSRKETSDGIQKLVKRGTEKIRLRTRSEINSNVENRYPGLKRDKLPDLQSYLETRKTFPREISAERPSAKLTTDIAQRLWDSGVTPKTWENADFEGRKQMILKAKQIMGQEMLLSPNVRQSLNVNIINNMKETSKLSGQLLQENNHFKVEKMQINLNSELLKKGDCETVLEALYREMMDLNQVDALSERAISLEEAKYLNQFVGKEFHPYSDFFKRTTESETYGQSYVFKLAYQVEGQKHPAEVATKPKEIVTEKAFVTSTELHADKIKEVFLQSSELQFHQWKKMDLNQKLTVLQNFENKIAEIEQRNPVPLFCENLSPTTNGYYTNAIQGTGKIALSSNLLNSSDYSGYQQTLKTLFHEGRHAYQDYNIRIARTEPSDDLIRQWKINREYFGYQVGDATLTGYYRYYTQPVEADANVFADATIRKIGL